MGGIVLGVSLGIYVMLVTFGVLRSPSDWIRVSRAKREINAAIDACSTSNKDIFDEKLIEAEETIDSLRWQDQSELNTSLSNRLLISMCPWASAAQ